MEKIMDIVALIIVSAGGTGAIIFCIAKTIGKSIAGAISEKYKAEIEKDIEKYKGEINYKLNKMDKIEEQALYVSKINYDNEFKIYLEIWPKLIKCIQYTICLYPGGIENVPVDEKEREKYMEEKYEKYLKSIKDFSDCIDMYAPFYQEDFYEDFDKIRTNCTFIGNIYHIYNFEVKYNLSYSSCRDIKIKTEEQKEIYEKEEELKNLRKNLQSRIREYLNDLKLNDKN